MNVGSNTVGKEKAFNVAALSLRNRISLTRVGRRVRIMKLMAARDCAGRAKDGVAQCCDFAITEVYKSIRHVDFGWYDPRHSGAIDRFGQIHETAAFGIEPLTGLDEV